MGSCSMCGAPIPAGQGTCSMCYGDIDHGSDGYYREFMERAAQEAAEQEAAEAAELQRLEEALQEERRQEKAMQVITPGHRYALTETDGQPQVIQFIEKVPEEEGSPKMRTVHTGTTNEEVIGMLIDRIHHLQSVMPCPENDTAVKHLALAYDALYGRTLERQRRGVEGQHTP